MDHDLVNGRSEALHKKYPAAQRVGDHTSGTAQCPCPFHNSARATEVDATPTVVVDLEQGSFECSSCSTKGTLDELLAGKLRIGVSRILTTKLRET